MKINLPVTGQEKLFPPDKTLVSKTDVQGIITFVNRDFVEVSGFSASELVGANHNIIRHPDMPAAVFDIMWKSLQRGLPWQGVVKNRCQNGDHYWVNAKVVPIKKNAQIIGYMSVRTCPSRQEVARAQAAYQAAASAPGTLMQEAAAGWRTHLSIRNGIPLWILFVTLMMVVGGMLGVTGLTLSNSAIKTLYYEEMEPVQAIGRINFLMAENRAQVALALHHNPLTPPAAQLGHPLASHLQTLLQNKEEIERLWQPYDKRISSAAERALADPYWRARNSYVQDGLLPAKLALEAGDYAQAERVLLTQVTPLYEQANASASLLLKHLTERGVTRFNEVTQRNRTIVTVAIAGIVLSCLALVVAGIFFFRVTVLPLQKAVLALEDIADGKLSGEVDIGGYGEPSRVMAAVKFMQTHLKVMMHEIQQSSDSIHTQCRHLNQTMMSLAETSEEQHDRVYQTLDASTESSTGLQAMAAAAEDLLPRLASGAADGPPAAAASAEATPPLASADLNHLLQEVAGAARAQSFAVDDVVRQLHQIAALIVQNREDVQGAWAASQQLEKTAGELEGLVKYFE